MNTWSRRACIATLALAAAVPAHAGYRGGHGWDHRPGHHHHHRHHGGGVWAPLIVGGLIGAAIVGASSAQAQPVQTVVVPAQPAYPVYPPSHLTPAPVAPPMAAPIAAPIATIPAPPPRVQYYCAPYRAYYPQISGCPEPWYLMPY